MEGFVCRVPGLGGRLRSAGAAPSDFASFALLAVDAFVDDIEDAGCEFMPIGRKASPFPPDQGMRPGGSNEVLFSLMARDVWASPDPEELFLDLVRYELLDYGYYYIGTAAVWDGSAEIVPMPPARGSDRSSDKDFRL